jgi:hypothetical protein
MAYELSYVYKLEVSQDSQNMSDVPLVYGASMTHSSIIVRQLPYLEAVRLPQHVRSPSSLNHGRALDPKETLFADYWRYGTFYKVWEGSIHHLLHVHDWMNAAPENVARLDGRLLLAMKVIG